MKPLSWRVRLLVFACSIPRLNSSRVTSSKLGAPLPNVMVMLFVFRNSRSAFCPSRQCPQSVSGVHVPGFSCANVTINVVTTRIAYLIRSFDRILTPMIIFVTADHAGAQDPVRETRYARKKSSRVDQHSCATVVRCGLVHRFVSKNWRISSDSFVKGG